MVCLFFLLGGSIVVKQKNESTCIIQMKVKSMCRMVVKSVIFN